ncbi:MAG TPA: serine hydrolase domain-containing protein [Cytophagaceae bacterium]|jgi:D-alanyl-D-alanine carboxypeptidase
MLHSITTLKNMLTARTSFLRNLAFSLLLVSCLACKKEIEIPVSPGKAFGFRDSSAANPKHARYRALVDKYVRKGYTGLIVSIYSPQYGQWLGAGGYARIENREKMDIANIHYIESVTKTFTAVAVMMLVEEGKIRLDEPMKTYLPEIYWKDISNGDRITVRQLLDHSSGITNYTENLKFISDAFNEYTIELTTEDYINYIKHKKALFEPGTKYSYSNADYTLLAKIMDNVTGDHASFMQKRIFDAIGLKHTYYHASPSYPKPDGLINSYFDRLGNGKVENVSDVQNKFTASFIGEDGMLSNVYDLTVFSTALFNGQLLKPSTLAQMQQFRSISQDSFDYEESGWTGYGLGLARRPTPQGDMIGHGGSLIGGRTEMYYFPSTGVAIAAAINVGAYAGGPLVDTFPKEFLRELAEMASE